MVKRRLTAVLALCPLLLHVQVSVAAADEALDTYTLPDVYVVAETVRADTVIDVAGAAPGTARTVPELLREAAGIQVQQRPNAGGNEDLTVKLRGHDSRHYTVLVDGVPMAGGGGSWAAAMWIGRRCRSMRWSALRSLRARNWRPGAGRWAASSIS